jgi:hypothetical protein
MDQEIILYTLDITQMDMAKFISDNFGNKLNDKKDVTSNGRIGIMWECHILLSLCDTAS